MGGGRLGEMVFGDPPGSFGAMSSIDKMELEQSLIEAGERRRAQEKHEKLQEFAILLGAEVTRRTIRQVVSSLAEDYGEETGSDKDLVVETAVSLLEARGIEVAFEEIDQRLHDTYEFIIDDDHVEDLGNDDETEGEK